MADRFWVGGTGTWNSSSTAFWAATSGGAGGQSVPGTSDVAIFDGSSGGGTVTVDSPNGAGSVTVIRITCGAFTGTLDFSANNNNVTLSGSSGTSCFNASGTGARTINLGSGTWTCTGSSGQNIWEVSTTTNLTLSGASANIVFTGNVSGGFRRFVGGGQSYGSFTAQTNSFRQPVPMTGNNTFGSLSLAAGTVFQPTGTQTITNGFTLAGTSSLPILIQGSATLSLGGTCTIDWGAINAITKSGAGSLTVTNGFDLGANSNVTITAPSGSSGARQKVYGG